MTLLSAPINTLAHWFDKIPLNYWIHRFIDLPTLLAQSNIPKGAKVLEVGCGTGQTSIYISQLLKSHNYTAIDNNPKAISEAETRASGNTKIIFQVADLCSLPFESSSFDVVIVLEVLHCVKDWKKALREIKRVLKKGGKLLMKDLSIETFTLPAVGLFLQQIFKRPYDHMYDQVEFLTFLRKNGFDIVAQNDSFWNLALVGICKKNEK